MVFVAKIFATSMPRIYIEATWNATFSIKPTKPAHHFLLIIAGTTIIEMQSNIKPILAKNTFTNQMGITLHKINTICFQFGFDVNDAESIKSVVLVIDITPASIYFAYIPSPSSQLQASINRWLVTAISNTRLPHNLNIIHAANKHQHIMIQVFNTLLFILFPRKLRLDIPLLLIKKAPTITVGAVFLTFC